MSQEIVLPLQKIMMSKGKKCMLARMPETFKTNRKTDFSKLKESSNKDLIKFEKRAKQEPPKPLEANNGKETMKKKVKGNEGQPLIQHEYYFEDGENIHPKLKQPAVFVGEELTDDSKFALLIKKKDVVEVLLIDSIITFKKIMELKTQPIESLLEKKRGRVSKKSLLYPNKPGGVSTGGAPGEGGDQDNESGSNSEDEAKKEKKPTFVEEEGMSDTPVSDDDEEDEEQKDFDRIFAKTRGLEEPDEEEKAQAKPTGSAPNTTGSKGKKKNVKSDRGSDKNSEASNLSDIKFSDVDDE